MLYKRAMAACLCTYYNICIQCVRRHSMLNISDPSGLFACICKRFHFSTDDHSRINSISYGCQVDPATQLFAVGTSISTPH